MDAGRQPPAGIATVLLARVDGPDGLWDSGPGTLADAAAFLDEAVAGHGGVRSAARDDGGDFVAAFLAAPEAVACALEVQRAPLASVRLRVCVHTGEMGSPDGVGGPEPVVGRAARLLDLAHGGQTLLTGVTGDVVGARLPEGAWLADLGSHRLADLGRAERVWQLCHPGVRHQFPALRSLDAVPHNLPVQLTRFIGRQAEMARVGALLADNRLATLTGAGGVGKTRLALQVAAGLAAGLPAGVWQVDLAPLTDAALIPVTVARALGLPDEAGRPAVATVTGFIAASRALVVLDNCEHLLDGCASLAEELLRTCPALTIMVTSREPVGVAGEATWRVPSLPLASEAVELFADRAQRARPGFVITPENEGAVAEICRRLDGMPLAIELAAARLRAFSPAEIAAGLHDRFRLLTGGSRTAVRRQQTLRASVDWSYALLTEPERIVFRRLAAFAGGFDLEAAQAVGAGGLERHQVLDLLALLVDKSLVVAEESEEFTRYQMLETIRQYALEKLSESGEADAVRARHRDHYTAMAARLDPPADGDPRRQIWRLEADIDNLRAAFQWSLELSDRQTALRLASSLQPVWLGRSRMLEGLAWFDAALPGDPATAEPITPQVRVRALADVSELDSWTDSRRNITLAGQAVAQARQLGDPALLGRALAAAGYAAGYHAVDGRPYFEEASALARQAGDTWTLARILGWQTFTAALAGDPVAVRSAGQEGLALARQTGNDPLSWTCRLWSGWAMAAQGDLRSARSLLSELVAEAKADKARVSEMYGLAKLGETLAFLGEPEQARAAGEASIAIVGDLGVATLAGNGYYCLAHAAMAAGDPGALREAGQAGWQCVKFRPEIGVRHQVHMAEAELAEADLLAARQHASQAVAAATRLGIRYQLMWALLASARVAAATGDLALAHDDAHQALITGHDIRAQPGIIDILEFLAGLAHAAVDQYKAARLLGAADALRQATGYRRFLLYQGGYDVSVAELRASVGDAAYRQAFNEGAALTLDDAVSYALRGRGARGRPAAGWPSLTPAERDVARLVAGGLANREIAARLFVSPRTVQTHLTHVYGKLGITSRVQLAQQAARHT